MAKPRVMPPLDPPMSAVSAITLGIATQENYTNNTRQRAGHLPVFGGTISTSHPNITLQDSNPFQTPTHSSHASESSANFVLSPVSPVDLTEPDSRSRQSRPRTVQPYAERAGIVMSDTRKTVDLRKLDGKPYPAGAEDTQDAQPRKVKVAQDMFAGEMPPMYDSQGYQGPLIPTADKRSSCHKCGSPKKGDSGLEKSPTHASNASCQKCGAKKSTPPSSFPVAAMANAQSRSQPQGSSLVPQLQSSGAGPSGHGHAHKHSCGKCGRKRRSDPVSSPANQTLQSPQAGLSFHRVPQIQTNGIPIMTVDPPTALTERAPTLPFTPTSAVGNTPLINHENSRPKYAKSHSTPSRRSSISSIFRSLSRRKKTEEPALPSQRLADAGERNHSNMVDKISHAMRDGETSSNGDSRVQPADYPGRPDSPFSFVDKPKEDQSFEMNDMRKSKQPARRNSWDNADEATNFLSDVSGLEARTSHRRSQSTRMHVRSQTHEAKTDDMFLTLPPDQRPGITRFKSLRAGYNRAADGLQRSASQIGRSPSLRRLESVKKVPQFWYRDDMAIEGAQSEYNSYVY